MGGAYRCANGGRARGPQPAANQKRQPAQAARKERTMSEQNGSGTAAQPAQAAAQPVTTGTGTTQATGPQIDPGEYQRLQRIEQQWKGAQPFVEKARGLGFKSADDFDRWSPVIQKVKDPSAFAKAWDGDPEPEQPLTPSQFEAMLDKRERTQREKAEEARHNSEFDAEMAELDEAHVAALFKDSPKEWQQVARNAMIGSYYNSRQHYDEGHPLHGKALRTLGKDGLGKIQSDTKAAFDALVKHFQGSNLAAIGEAASKSAPRGALAGATPPAGAPGNSKGSGTRAERTKDFIREAAAKQGIASP